MSQATDTASSWKAYLELHLCHIGGTTRLVPKKRFGPLTVQRAFYPEGDLCHLYLLHPPGGVVGGDQLHLEVKAESLSHTLITAPGANKFYRSAGGIATYQQNFVIESDASLEFLPLENIYFPGAFVNSNTHITVGENSQFIYWESHCFGRPSIEEKFESGEVTISIDIEDSDGLLLTEKQRVSPEQINRSAVMRGYAVLSSMLVYGYKLNQDEMQLIRDVGVEQGYIGVTQFTENLLIIRYLGASTADVQLAFRKIWALLRALVIKRPPCMPRIWNT